MWIQHRDSPLLLYHYVGSLAQWMYRNDARVGKRTLERYEAFSFLNTTRVQESMTHWVKRFVEEVGVEQATVLLQGVGQVVAKNHSDDTIFLNRLLESFAEDSQHHRSST